MFQPYIEKLTAVHRFDRVVNSQEVEVGEVQCEGENTRLALELPTGDVLTLEERGEHQLVSQWSIPPDHFRRLPHELRVRELHHFSHGQPKQLTYRAVSEPGKEYPALRSVMSAKYTPFDNADVLQVIEPILGDYELERPAIHRDEMVIVLTRPETFDISQRKVGDLVKAGLTLRNSEVGTMSLGVEISTWRLKCLNGMILPSPDVTLRQRHIWIDRKSFEQELQLVIGKALDVSLTMIDRLRKTHELQLPNLDPDSGKLQEAVTRVLRREGIWSETFRRQAEEALGYEEEATLFGLVQYLTGPWAKQQPEDIRLDRERAAGRLLALAA